MQRAHPPLPTASTPVSPETTLGIAQKHSAAVRWTHWINFPLLSIMIWSGFLIYWAASSTDHTAPHQVYRIGFGSWTLIRLFPDSFYEFFHLDGHLTRGLAFHALGMWAFIVNGLVYFIFLAVSGQWRNITPTRADLAHFAAGLRRLFTKSPTQTPAPQQTKYNPFQRLAYGLINLMAVGAVVTGLAIWKPTSLHLITTLCGGYQSARLLHFWLTIGFCLFFFVHLLQVARAGWKNLRSMIVGVQVAKFAPITRNKTRRQPTVVLPSTTQLISGGSARE